MKERTKNVVLMRRKEYKYIFFNDTATTEIYTLSLHDTLPISHASIAIGISGAIGMYIVTRSPLLTPRLFRTFANLLDRKSTRLNSSHANISYAVFCLKKQNIISWLYP